MKLYTPEDTWDGPSYKDVLGMRSAKILLKNCIEKPLKCPSVYDNHLVTVQRIISLFGLPGSGKYTLVRAFCKLHKLNLIVAEMHDFSKTSMSTLVSHAILWKPCVVLFKNCDTLFTDHNYNIALEFALSVKNTSHSKDTWFVIATYIKPSEFSNDVILLIKNNLAWTEILDFDNRKLLVERALTKYAEDTGMDGMNSIIIEIAANIAKASESIPPAFIIEFLRGVFKKKIDRCTSSKLLSANLFPSVKDISNFLGSNRSKIPFHLNSEEYTQDYMAYTGSCNQRTMVPSKRTVADAFTYNMD